MKLVQDSKTGLYFRPQKMDEWIIRERTSYRKLLEGIDPGFSAFDVGANIGAFAYFCLEYGADSIVCLEPEETNFKILCKNFEGNEKILPYKVAAASSHGKIPFYVNDKKNTGNHSMVAIHGRRQVMVDCVDFQSWISVVEPDILKIDIEGGEYMLDFSNIDRCVHRVAIELHLGRKLWRNEKAPELIQTIESMGFKPVRKPKITDSNWYTLGIWSRK